MGVPAWFLEDPGDITNLPRKFTWMSERYDVSRTRIMHVTQFGVKHGYNLSRARVYRYVFRVPETLLTEYMAIDTATFGDVLPFYFVPDIDDFVSSPIGGAVYVRKETEFRPTIVGPFYWEGEGLVQMYDYTLELTEEIPAIEIED